MTPSDFAVMVSNLPSCTPEELKEHFESQVLNDIKVEYVNISYKIDDFV